MRKALLLLVLFAGPAEAAISFHGVGTPDCSATSGATLTGALPASTAANDIAIMFAFGEPTDTTVPSTPTDFTQRFSRFRENGTNDVGLVTYWKKLVGSDANPTTTVPASWSGTTAGGMCVVTLVWRGVDTTTAHDTADVGSDANAAMTFTPTGITTVTNDAWAISACVTADDNALNYSVTQSFVDRASGATYDTTIGGDFAIGIADKPIPAFGAVTMPTWNQSVNGTDDWDCASIALRPAAGAPAGCTTTRMALTGAGCS